MRELAARDIALEKDRQTIPKGALHLGLAGARGAKPRDIGSKGSSSQEEKRMGRIKRGGE